MSQSEPPLIRPVILCGGAGTRLWPLSRKERPKQFLKLNGDQSLLRQTLSRVTDRRFAPALIVSGQEQASLVDDELREEDPIEAILLEPVSRNTATAAALAATWLNQIDGDQLMLLMPSDHVIGDRRAFFDAIELGVPHAAAGAIVTFGAKPTEANTQYGYIEASSERGPADGTYAITRFHEKPDAARAESYIATGRFYWNCGIFLVRASTLLEELDAHVPQTRDAVSAALAGARTDGPFVSPAAEPFSRAANISIDNAIMEKTNLGVVVPVSMDWSDVGAWDAVWKLAFKDADGNATHGQVLALDSSNCLLRSDGGAKIGAIGLHNIAVVAVDDAILVTTIERAADVKELLSKMASKDSAPKPEDS